MALIIDIETLPDLRVPEEERGEGWRSGPRDEVATKWDKTGVKPECGLLWMVGIRHSEDEARKVNVFVADDPLKTSEDVLFEVDNYIGESANQFGEHSLYPLVAHHAVFDLSWMSAWALKYRMRRLYDFIPNTKFPKRNQVFCTMKEFCGIDHRGYASLRNVATFLGLPEQKIEINSVLDYYLKGEVKECQTYCGQDVLTCEAIWKRLEWKA